MLEFLTTFGAAEHGGGSYVMDVIFRKHVDEYMPKYLKVGNAVLESVHRNFCVETIEAADMSYKIWTQDRKPWKLLSASSPSEPHVAELLPFPCGKWVAYGVQGS
jgi:hypothetical protein